MQQETKKVRKGTYAQHRILINKKNTNVGVVHYLEKTGDRGNTFGD